MNRGRGNEQDLPRGRLQRLVVATDKPMEEQEI